jgi:transposase
MVAPLLPGKRGDPGRSGDDNRKALEGMLWVVRTGAPWRDLPAVYGRWNTIHRRFRRWTKAGVFDRIFEVSLGDIDVRTVQVDGSYVKVHQHGSGSPKTGVLPVPQPSMKPSDVAEEDSLQS